MARRLLILSSLLLLSVPVLWLALSGSSAEPVLPAWGSNAEDAADAAPALPPESDADVPELPAEHSTRVAAPDYGSASAAAPGATQAKCIEIHIVDKATGAPVAGADVAWMDGTTWERVRGSNEDRQWLAADLESIARSLGWRARSDERGVVSVRVSDWTGVFAREGTRYGSLQYTKNARAPRAGYRIELVEDRTLHVQVLDAGGRPAIGVPIAVALHGADGAFLRLWESRVLARSEQPDGRARIQHMQEWRERSRGGEVLVPAAQWRVRVEVPGSRDPGVAFDPKAPPEEPVVLRLPPTGRVAARVELRGQRVPVQPNIGLYVGALDDQAARNRAWSRAPAADGQVRFPYVPVGCTFVAFARLDMTTVQREFAGPTLPDEEVTVVLNPADDEVMLAGRVLDDHQQLVRDAQLLVHFHTVRSGNGSDGDTALRTNADGQFLFFLGPIKSKELRLERFAIERFTKDGMTLRAQIPPRDLRPGVQDIGDLVLEAGPLVVAGRFLEGDKPYLNYVAFSVERKQIGGGNPRESWETVKGLTPSQDRAGNFAVRGEAGPGQYRLSLSAWDHLPVAPVEFVPGTVDLEVQIARGEQLGATVLAPPGLPWGMKAVLRPDAPGTAPNDKEDPSLPNRFRAEPWEKDAGRYQFQWPAVAPGIWTLELRLWGVAEPLLSIPGVQVPPAPGDGRLEDIDLRDKVTVLTVHTASAAGKPAKDALVFQRPLDPAAVWFAYQVANNALRMPVRPGPVDLLVAGARLRPREVRAAQGDVDVVVEPWSEIELVFPDLPELPAGYALEVMLLASEFRDRGRYVTRTSSGWREELFRSPMATRRLQNGRVSLPIGDGAQRLYVILRGASGRGAHLLRGVTPGEVTAGAGAREGTGAVVEVHIPAAAVRDAIAEQQKAGKGG